MNGQTQGCWCCVKYETSLFWHDGDNCYELVTVCEPWRHCLSITKSTLGAEAEHSPFNNSCKLFTILVILDVSKSSTGAGVKARHPDLPKLPSFLTSCCLEIVTVPVYLDSILQTKSVAIMKASCGMFQISLSTPACSETLCSKDPLLPLLLIVLAQVGARITKVISLQPKHMTRKECIHVSVQLKHCFPWALGPQGNCFCMAFCVWELLHVAA